MSDFSHMCLNVHCSVRMRELINTSSVTFEFFALLFCLFAYIKLALQLETIVLVKYLFLNTNLDLGKRKGSSKEGEKKPFFFCLFVY